MAQLPLGRKGRQLKGIVNVPGATELGKADPGPNSGPQFPTAQLSGGNPVLSLLDHTFPEASCWITRKTQTLHQPDGLRLWQEPLSASLGFPRRYLTHRLLVPGDWREAPSYPYRTDGDTEAGSDLCQ